MKNPVVHFEIPAYPCVASRYSLVSDSPWMRMAVDAVWSFASYGQK